MSAAPGASATLAVAISGGRDSTALLHAVLRGCVGSTVRVLALHVHHGLQPEADGWVRHLQRQCRRWRSRIHPLLELQVERLATKPGRGESVEAWARQQRYAALARMARSAGAGHLLLAHHRSDQAETVLLQALRGAAAAGLSAMPALVNRQGLTWHRPWLDSPATAVNAYVARFRLAHIEDPSNADPRFDRNRLRHQVLPGLRAAFPQFEHSLQQVASHAQTAQALIDEIAQSDVTGLVDDSGRLVLDRLHQLSPARRHFALRAWLRQMLPLSAVHESLLARLLTELPEAQSGSRWPGAEGLELGLQRGALAVLNRPARAGAGAKGAASWPPPFRLAALQEGRHPVPGWGGALTLVPVVQGGIAAHWLQLIELRGRRGGEQFQWALDRPPRSLKKQFQAAGMATWQRTAPLVFSLIEAMNSTCPAGQLLLVPGLGLDARAWAAPGERQWQLQWLPDEGGS